MKRTFASWAEYIGLLFFNNFTFMRKTMLRCCLPLLLLLMIKVYAAAQCPPGTKTLKFAIQPDEYWYETSWEIIDASGQVLFSDELTNSEYAEFTYCVPEGGCKIFRLKDEYGDGITPGNYKLYLDEVLIYDNPNGLFTFINETSFDCAPGEACSTAIPLFPGAFTMPDGGETWYVFFPTTNGQYLINTCDSANTCPTKIWVYDRCEGIVLSNNQTGALFYADGGCANGAEANLFLAGNKSYYIRIRAAQNCQSAPVGGVLQYVGPIAGCTDPAACNYNPLATVSAGGCIYPGDPDCPNQPDLVLREDIMRNSMTHEFIQNPDQCAVEEGCLRGTGARSIVRFTTHIQNIGQSDYYIGETPASPQTPSDQFVWDPCHNHWHYRGYAEYLLYGSNGVRTPVGSKNGFCVIDLECAGGGQGKYTCENMGITAGCGDIYDAGLPCQWVDISDIPADTYTLVMRVNWDKSPDKLGQLESDYSNNWAQACFTLTYVDGSPLVDFINDCPEYTDCLGEVFGSAELDCNGICNGPGLRGDWNLDTLRTASDVLAYLDATLTNDPADLTDCRDLYDDNVIDVYDAALLQECNLYENEPQHWGVRLACSFPGGVYNDKDLVYLLPGTLDTLARTFDVDMVNPYNKMLGYEFTVGGLKIDSIVNLVPEFDGQINFNIGNEIVALAPGENTIKKTVLPRKLLRIHYSELTAPQVCITAIQAIVNDKYMKVNSIIGPAPCVGTGSTGTNTPNAANIAVFVQPNPFEQETSIFFENELGEAFTFTLNDLNGRILRRIENLRADNLQIERGDLPAGIYYFKLESARSHATGKLIIK